MEDITKEINKEEFNTAVELFMKLTSWQTMFDFARKNKWTSSEVKTYMSRNKKSRGVILLNEFIADSWYKNTKAPIAAGKYYENELNIATALPEFELTGTMVDFQQRVERKFTINQGTDTDIDDHIQDYLAELENLDDPDKVYTPEELEEYGIKVPED